MKRNLKDEVSILDYTLRGMKLSRFSPNIIEKKRVFTLYNCFTEKILNFTFRKERIQGMKYLSLSFLNIETKRVVINSIKKFLIIFSQNEEHEIQRTKRFILLKNNI